MIFQNYPEILFATSRIADGNMDFRSGESKKILGNRQKFLSALGVNLDSAIALRQQHGDQVIRVGKVEAGRGARNDANTLEGDGLVTNQAGIYLIIKAADCHQIALYDSKNKAIALIHAGWRGLDKGITGNAVKTMSNEFGTQPKNLIVQFGPAIGPCCYKISDPKQKNDPKWQPYIKKGQEETFQIDLWTMAEDQLKEAGVLPENIDNPRVCTYHNSEYFSHRRAVIRNSKDFEFMTILGTRE